MYTNPPFSSDTAAYPGAPSEKRLEEPPDDQERRGEDARNDPDDGGDAAQDDERGRPPLATADGLTDALTPPCGLVAVFARARHG
jgi:hypothetical protein